MILANFWVYSVTEGKTYSRISKIPPREVALVLGTSPKMKSGVANPYFTYRMDATALLYHHGIAGGTGSGKTTVVNNILQQLNAEGVNVLSQDNYYHDNHHLSLQEREALNYDHPKSIDFELLTKHVKALKNGENIEQPLYSFVTHSRTGDYVTVEPKNVLIVEGILVLTNPELLKEFDLKVFVHADSDERLIRRIKRDTQERGRDLHEVLHRYQTTLKPMHQEFIEPSKNEADLIVPNMRRNSVAIDFLSTSSESLKNLPKVEESTHLVARYQEGLEEDAFAFLLDENVENLSEKTIFIHNKQLAEQIKTDESNRYFSLIDVFENNQINQKLGKELLSKGFEKNICVDASLYQNAGASISQQLAFALGKAKDLAEIFGSEILSKLVFRFAIGSNYFFEIAKIRAFKQLFNQLSKEFSLDEIPYIFAETSHRNKAKNDEENNLIRSTLEIAAAMIAGSDAVFANDFKVENSTELSQEISFKQQVVLAYESIINVFDDAANGSYYVEDITYQFAKKAWELFLEIENSGGFLENLNSGKISELIYNQAIAEQNWVKEEVSMQELVQQIKGRKVAEKKFPFLNKENIIFPPNLNLEQASSQDTAEYKAQFFQGGNKGALKKTDDVVRYDDENAEAPTYKEKTDTTTAKTVAPVAAKVDSTAHK
ncbi:hypothetical protein Lal_00042813 [Lupinus albus]|nr:hypothetical protein Lal_00042813 [Lupinus albus]